MARILAIDDDRDILVLVKNILKHDNHLVYIEDNTENLPLEMFQHYDLILVDVMMPNVDGFELCKKIRHAVDCPILFLTAKVSEESIVKGLAQGGDDYLTKPFGVQELRARVGAHLRREQRDKNYKKRVISGITFDFDSKEVFIHEEKIMLTKNEYKICELLATNKGRTFSKEEIYNSIYGLDGNALHTTITEYIRCIRKKLKAHNLTTIVTVWGLGYKWE